MHRSRQFSLLVAIAAGGFLGALGRYELGLAWPTPSGHIPWATFMINTSGSFMLGLILTVLLERLGRGRYLRPFVCVGVLGAWTTMSTYAVEADLLIKDGHLGTAIAYIVGTVLAGLAAAWSGVALARGLNLADMPWSSP